MAWAGDPERHGTAQRLTHRDRQDKAFTGRTFIIEKEVRLPPGQVFVTQFGHRGRHGYIIRDTETGERQIVGQQLLELINKRYNGVALPRKPRHHRFWYRNI